MGRLHAKGKAFVPYVKRELYDRLRAAAGSASSPDATPGKASQLPLEQSLAKAKEAMASALPSNWETIKPGHMVLLQESIANGWFEAVVVAREQDMLTLQFRDYSKYPSIIRHVRSVGLVHPGLI